jgi:hypothetical protein
MGKFCDAACPPQGLRRYTGTDFAYGTLACGGLAHTKLARSASEVWRRRESNPKDEVPLSY